MSGSPFGDLPQPEWDRVESSIPSREPKIYFDFRDWWIGYYRSSDYHYVCPLPTLVIRWRRRSYWTQEQVERVDREIAEFADEIRPVLEPPSE